MKLFYRLSLFLFFAALYACESKKQQQPEEVSDMPVFEFSSEDSLTINEMAQNYVSCFNAGDFETAANMLYTVRNDSVFPLTDEQKQDFSQTMRHLPAYGFKLKELTLKTDLDNRVRIAVLMSEQGSLDEEVSTINYYLNPVKVQGQWYLTVFDKHAEGVGVY